MFIKRAYDALRLIWGDSPIYLWGRALTLDTVYLFCKISVNLPTHKSLPSKPNPLRRRSQPHPQRLHIRPKVTQPKHEAKHNPPKISRIYILVKRVAQIRSRFLGIFLIYTQGHESRRTFLRGVATRPRDHARSGHTSGRGNTSHWSRWSRRCDWSSALHPIPIAKSSSLHRTNIMASKLYINGDEYIAIYFMVWIPTFIIYLIQIWGFNKTSKQNAYAVEKPLKKCQFEVRSNKCGSEQPSLLFS